MSLMASFCAVIFPRDVLGDIWDLIESVSEGFPTYFCTADSQIIVFILQIIKYAVHITDIE